MKNSWIVNLKMNRYWVINFGGAKAEIKDEKEAFLAIIYVVIVAHGIVELKEMNALTIVLIKE
jgi:hypothetical protein